MEAAAAAQKPAVNGTEALPAVAAFRHSLPQIAMMDRNPKIAQSKVAPKSDVTQVEHSTTDVEGVGKVVHIGWYCFFSDQLYRGKTTTEEF